MKRMYLSAIRVKHLLSNCECILRYHVRKIKFSLWKWEDNAFRKMDRCTLAHIMPIYF